MDRDATAMEPSRCLSGSLLDAPMQHYFEQKFSQLAPPELALRIEETLRFLFISHECTGAIPVSRELDDIWHAWILQTQEYMALCGKLPTGQYVHHSSNDYLAWFDPAVGGPNELDQDVKMLALYVANFGPFDQARARHWLLAHHLMQRHGWSVDELNAWLQWGAGDEEDGSPRHAGAAFAALSSRPIPPLQPAGPR